VPIRRWDDPKPAFEYRLLAVALTACGVELLRLRLHPAPANQGLLVIAVAATIGLHVWSMPDDLKRSTVSAFFTEASMPVVIGLASVLIQAIIAAGLAFLRAFIPQV
jgi:hypothetical protein